MYKTLSIFALVMSLLFVILMIITFLELPIGFLFDYIDWYFGVPHYIIITVSFVLSAFYWITNRNKEQFRYLVYSTLGVILTGGTLAYILYQFAMTMSDFD